MRILKLPLAGLLFCVHPGLCSSLSGKILLGKTGVFLLNLFFDAIPGIPAAKVVIGNGNAVTYICGTLSGLNELITKTLHQRLEIIIAFGFLNAVADIFFDFSVDGF